MRYHIMAPSIELSDRMRDTLLRKLQKLERFVQRFPADGVDVVATVDRQVRTDDFVVSLRLNLNGTALVSKEQAPQLQQAVGAAIEDVLDQLNRYKAKLRGDALIAHSRTTMQSEELAEVLTPLLEQRELYDRAMAGDQGAFQRLLEEDGFSLQQVLRQELRQHGVDDGPEQDTLAADLLGHALIAAQQDMEHKPSRMSVSGWLALKVRKAAEDHFRRPESGGLQGVA